MTEIIRIEDFPVDVLRSIVHTLGITLVGRCATPLSCNFLCLDRIFLFTAPFKYSFVHQCI
jgi:hypothetical protein